MPENPSSTKVLVLDQACDKYFDDLLCAAFPHVRFEACVNGVDAQRHASDFQPDVILSAKSRNIPGPMKRLAMQIPSVNWIQICGVGFDHVQPITDFSATVTNCAGVLSEFLGETIFGMMLAMSYGFPAYFHQQIAKQWKPVPRRSISGKTVLIIGLGNVGRDVARRCKQSNMRVIGIRNRPIDTEFVDKVGGMDDLITLLGEADYVCLHTPLTDQTRAMLGKAEFAAMKPGAFFLNGARGGIVDEGALLAALESGHLAGAYSDVFETEPLPPDNPLWTAPNLIISPHTSDSIDDWERRYVVFFATNLERYLNGEPLLNVVNAKLGY
ncbi:MAG: D-2-hydroxyacid dehydrogenase [Pseudomonadota bacterium]